MLEELKQAEQAYRVCRHAIASLKLQPLTVSQSLNLSLSLCVCATAL
jgi:hypothetical protein